MELHKFLSIVGVCNACSVSAWKRWNGFDIYAGEEEETYRPGSVLLDSTTVPGFISVFGYGTSCVMLMSIKVSSKGAEGSTVCTLLCTGILEGEEERPLSWTRVALTAANASPRSSCKKGIVCW